MTPIRLAIVGAAILVASTVATTAHQLTVFAHIEGTTVVVGTKFSSGKIPIKGDVRVLDGNNNLQKILDLTESGTVRFPLDSVNASDGLLIEVDVGNGHEDYWILTPDDIARQTGYRDQ